MTRHIQRVFVCLSLVLMPSSVFAEWRILAVYETGTKRSAPSTRYRLHGGALSLHWSSSRWTVGGHTQFRTRVMQESSSMQDDDGSDTVVSLVAGYRVRWWSIMGGLAARHQTDMELGWRPAVGFNIGPRNIAWLNVGYYDGQAVIPALFRLGIGGRIGRTRMFVGWSSTDRDAGASVQLELPIEGPVFFSIATVVDPTKPSQYLVLASSIILRLDESPQAKFGEISHW